MTSARQHSVDRATVLSEPTGCEFGDLAAGSGFAHANLPTRGKIALLEHCGTGNLGDDATVESALQHIRARWPAAQVVGLSLDPVDSEKRHGIQCHAIRQSVFPFKFEWTSTYPGMRRSSLDPLKNYIRKKDSLHSVVNAIWNIIAVWPMKFGREILFLILSFYRLYDIDLLVICGGGQLLDWGGPWAFPYTLLKWVALAKCAGAKCIFLNNGAGPLDSPLSRRFVMQALAMSDYVSTRDRKSADLLRTLGFKGQITLATDCAWGLRLPEGLQRRKPDPDGELVIGVAPMAYGDSSRHWQDNSTAYRHLIEGLAEFCVDMLRRGRQVRLFSSDIWFDSKALADLKSAICAIDQEIEPERIICDSVADIDEFLAALARVDCFVTCRYHGVLLASLLDVPSIALAPHPKVASLMADMGLSKYCLDIVTFEPADVTERLEDLIANKGDAVARVHDHVTKFRGVLNSQFDFLFPPWLESAAAHRGLQNERSAP